MSATTRRLAALLLLGILLLLGMYLLSRGLPWVIRDRFDLNGEANLPTWYATALLGLVAVAALGVQRLEERRTAERGLGRYFWLGFGLAYAFLSADEAARLHEILDGALRVKWLYLYVPVAALFVLACLCYLPQQTARLARLYILAGLAVSAMGGMGFELLDHLYPLLPKSLFLLEMVGEEGLEMVGSVLVLVGCLAEVERRFAARDAAQTRLLSR